MNQQRQGGKWGNAPGATRESRIAAGGRNGSAHPRAGRQFWGPLWARHRTKWSNIAALFGVEVSYAQKMLAGQWPLPAADAAKLARLLGVTVKTVQHYRWRAANKKPTPKLSTEDFRQ